MFFVLFKCKIDIANPYLLALEQILFIVGGTIPGTNNTINNFMYIYDLQTDTILNKIQLNIQSQSFSNRIASGYHFITHQPPFYKLL